MWDRRKLLLAAFIFPAVFYRVTAKQLDEAPEAVEDPYNGCRQEALNTVIHSGLLQQELNDSKQFEEAWSEHSKCSMVIPGGVKEHAVALAVYVNEDHLLSTYKTETLILNGSTYTNNFPFQSLHFLLMDALMLLRQKDCRPVYFLTEKDYNPKPGTRVRFGTFNVVHQDMDSLENDLDDMTVFNVTTCFFVNLTSNGCVRQKNVALLSPAEEFTVEGVRSKKQDDADYMEIVLKHSKMLNFHRCQSASGSPAHVSSQWLVSLLLASSLFFFYC